MAPVFNVLRTCGLTFCLLWCVAAAPDAATEPWISSIEVAAKNCAQNICKYLLNVRGGEFLGHYSWRLTPSVGSRGVICDTIYPNYELNEIKTSQWFTKVEITVPLSEGRIFFCLHHNKQQNNPFGGKWIHQGEKLFLEPKEANFSSEIQRKSETTKSPEPLQKDKGHLEEKWTDLSHDIDVNHLPNVSRPTREESNDIELFVNNNFVPLNDVTDIEKINFNDIQPNEDIYDDERTKRSVDVNETDFDNELDVEYPEDVIDEENTQFSQELIPISENESIEIIYNIPITDDVVIPSQTDDDDDENARSKREISNWEQFSNDLIGENENSTKNDDATAKLRPERQIVADDDFTSVKAVPQIAVVEGIRVEDSSKEPKIVDDGIPSVLADSSVTLRLFGEGLSERTAIAFTNYPQEFGQPCKFILAGEHMAKEGSVSRKSALFDITAPSPITGPRLYLCVKNLRPGVTDLSKDEDKYIHQGTDNFKVLATHNSLLPLWVSMILIMTCLTFSALFSGLNLGLMSLDRTELKIISNTGTEQERKYARAIMPVRDHGNYLLCSILLGNVAVNSTFTILLDELTSGLFAVIFSTLAIVLLGEITPQAICSRHGLMVGAKSICITKCSIETFTILLDELTSGLFAVIFSTLAIVLLGEITPQAICSRHGLMVGAESICITKAVMAITAPLAFPVSKLLDYFLGEEIGSVYNRERLKELVKVTTDVNDLDKDEVNIISGALELRKKKVSEVMTKLEDVFMLPISSVLDFETMSEIIKSGYSRIPVYEGGRGNIVTVLFIKDLAFVDPDDNTPLRTLCQYYQNPCNFVFEDVTLDVMFKQFKEGHKGHMAFVHRINNEGEGDPFYETIGLVTLEDVIEEMIQAEIVDETDVFLDNRTKRRRNKPQNKLQDFAAFAEKHDNQRIHISPQLTLATFQFLSTSVDAFRPDTVSETVLRRLLRQDVIQHIKLKGKTKKDPTTFVFQQGKPVDYFVLILEGRVEVTVGRENLVFEAGPFTYFGVQALTQNIAVAESPTPSAMGSLQNITVDAMLKHTFIPDYSVRAITELFYLTVKRSLHLAAKRATLMEKGALSKGATNEQFDTEVDKLLQSVDEDLSITGEHKTPSRQISPNPMPVSASPLTRSSFTSRTSPEIPRNGDLNRLGEQERLLNNTE